MAPKTITAEVNGRVMTWVPGIIGTDAWRREGERASAERAMQRDAAIPATATRADASAGFNAMPAPSGIGEACKTYNPGIGGTSGDAPAVPFGVRSLVRDARCNGIRRHRRAVMADARRNESKRRATAPQDIAPATASPLVRLAQDIAAGTFPRPDATVTERVYIVKGAEDTIVTRRRPTDTRNCRRIRIDAPGWAVALERLHRDYRDETSVLVATMTAEPSNDGRGAIAHRAPDAVNGTEVRGMPRWHGTPASAVRGEDGRLIDRTCYRVLRNGRRVPLVTTATARQRKATVAATVAARLTAASLPRVIVD